MTLCNMVTELGGRTGLVMPDDSVAAWLQDRPCAPTGAEWDAAIAAWQALYSDEDAVFDQDLDLDCSALEPQITWGIDPGHVVGLSGRVPDPSRRRLPNERFCDVRWTT